MSIVVYYIRLYLSTLSAPPLSLGLGDGDDLVTFEPEGQKGKTRNPSQDRELSLEDKWRGRPFDFAQGKRGSWFDSAFSLAHHVLSERSESKDGA